MHSTARPNLDWYRRVGRVNGRIEWSGAIASVLIVLAGLAAYHNSLSGPFVFDAKSAIVENPTIRHILPMRSVLSPPAGGSAVSGRPLVNLSLAANYAWGGLNVRGYHVVNLLIHVLAGLTLFGVVRGTLAKRNATSDRAGAFGSWGRDRACITALAVAALWTVHPLQTESVTYVAQRSESLMGLFYLFTLYSFFHGSESDSPLAKSGWLILSFAACALGMATKEVMATAPLMVFLFDRTFVAGSFREAWRQRRNYYLSIAGTWLLLAYLVAGTGGRGGTVGFSTSIPWRGYALTQFRAILIYLRLSLWPHPLVLDYGLKWGGHPLSTACAAVMVIALLIATIVALRIRPALGFLGAWFFVILAPSSSIVPVATELIAEHRMYLPLAAIIVLTLVGLFEICARAGAVIAGALVLAFILLTVQRNQIYESELALWRNTVKYAPESAGAHDSLGLALAAAGNLPAATREFLEAFRLDPQLPGPRNNLGNALLKSGRVADAVANDQALVRLYPDFPSGHANLGRALSQSDRLPEAVAEYRTALKLRPNNPIWLQELGAILAQTGQLKEAIATFESALQIDPDNAVTQTNLGGALLQTDHLTAAIPHFEKAIRLDPNRFEAQMNLGTALVKLGRTSEAIGHYQTALQLQPDNPAAHYNLSVALRILGRTKEAKAELIKAQGGTRPSDAL